MSMEDQMNELLAANGKYNDEKKDKATELVIELAKLCQGYEPDVVLLVLESALTEEIRILSPVIGELFERSMMGFKDKAKLLLTLAEVAQTKLGRTEPKQ